MSLWQNLTQRQAAQALFDAHEHSAGREPFPITSLPVARYLSYMRRAAQLTAKPSAADKARELVAGLLNLINSKAPEASQTLSTTDAEETGRACPPSVAHTHPEGC